MKVEVAPEDIFSDEDTSDATLAAAAAIGERAETEEHDLVQLAEAAHGRPVDEADREQEDPA